jgi:ketosteroid isomerase-like protein
MVHAMDAEFMRNFAAKDAERLARDFYSEDAQLLLPHQRPAIGRPAIGRPAIRGAFAAMMGEGLLRLVLQTTKIEVSGDLGYGIGLYKITATLGSGVEIQDEGKYVVVYRRQHPGAWRAVADIINSDLPVPRG